MTLIPSLPNVCFDVLSFVLKMLNEMTVDPTKSIPAFYAGQSIFLTGATGFLGKVFIEKVLRSCPDVREIFLLMRPKKGLSIKERLDKMLKLPLYEKLCEERPSNFEKLIPISGDVNEKELGLSARDKQILAESVTIIIHAAASVKFNVTLKYAIFTHTRATRDICILAQSMKNLIALVYVSTIFTNVNKPLIEEKTYPPITDWQKMIEVAESLDEHALNIFTAKYLEYAPNTYIFSKNLTESVIKEYTSLLNCAIVRPSMVIPSLKEPFPGWIDNIYGPLGLFLTGGKGILRVAACNKHVQVNVVPVDIVIKAILVVSWKLGLTTLTTNHIPFVLNCASQRYITYQNYKKMGYSILNEIPFEGTVWTLNTILTDNFILFYILTILLHILPAMLIDLILKFSGRRPMMVQLQRQMYMAANVLNYFSKYQWQYSNTNSLDLISLIPPDNQEMFSFDYSYINDTKYCKVTMIGLKKFIFHEDMNRLDAAKAHNKRVYLFVTMVKSIISVGVLWIIYKWIYY